MELALNDVKNSLNKGDGGPFGACIVDSNGKVIAVAHNQVIKNNDPTAHAEIEAIRIASKKLNTYDLTGCIMYTTCMPCPMCLSAIIWANIKEVYYGCSKSDADDIGFRDKLIYDYINGTKKDILTLKELNHDECMQVFKEYKDTIY